MRALRFLWGSVTFVLTAGVLLAVVGVATLVIAPQVAGVKGVIVLTGSMEPALKTGGLAFMRPLTNLDEGTVDVRVRRDALDAIEVGDIITFRAWNNPRQQISHRLIEIVDAPSGREFLTKGDNSPEPDRLPVPADAVVGTIEYHIPYIGWLADWARHRNSFLLLVGIPAAAIIAIELSNIVREMRRLRAERERPLRDVLQ